MANKVWQNLTGTMQSIFKFGRHRLKSYTDKVAIETRQGAEIAEFSPSTLKLLGKSITTGTAIPTTGIYVAGDVIWNSNPGTGDPASWVCVESGTPGTWEAIGSGASSNPTKIINGTTEISIPDANGDITFKVNNINFGTWSLGNEPGTAGNLSLGENTLNSLTTGLYNIAIGTDALALTTAPNYNVAIGSYALANNTIGSDNNAVGDTALFDNTTGSRNTAQSYSLYNNTTGNDNTAIGYDALSENTIGSSNTAVGNYSGNSSTTGSNNTFIGYQSVGSSPEASNEISLGNTDVSTFRIPGLSFTLEKDTMSAAINGQALVLDSTLGIWKPETIEDPLPSQTGNEDKFLTTDGTDASWAVLPASGHTIENEGTPVTQRTKLNFIGTGVTVTDNSGDDSSEVEINLPTTGSGLNLGAWDSSGTFTTGVRFDGSGDKVILPKADTATRSGITLIEAEVIYDTTEDKLYVGDGSTAGGLALTSNVSDGDKGDVVVSSSGTVWSLDTTGVSAGSYTNCNVTVDAKGRVTAISSSTVREVLTANRTYYVRTDGSDSNNGLSDSSGGAFLTIQKAIDVVASLDLSIYDVIIQVQATTFTNQQLILKSPLGNGLVTLRGDTSNANQSSYVISSKTGSGASFEHVLSAENLNCRYRLEGLTFNCEASENRVFIKNSTIEIKDCRFKKGTGIVSNILQLNNCYCSILGTITFEGAFYYTINCGYNSVFDAYGLGTGKIIGVSYSNSLTFFLGRLGAVGDFANTTATGLSLVSDLDASSTFRTVT